MIYCVNEPGWSIVIPNGYDENFIRLRVGDKIYTDDNKIVTLIHVQSEYNGEIRWYWRKIPSMMNIGNNTDTLFTHESYHNVRTSTGVRYSKSNLLHVLSFKTPMLDITKAEHRQSKLNSLTNESNSSR